jgi:hypothetical protein
MDRPNEKNHYIYYRARPICQWAILRTGPSQLSLYNVTTTRAFATTSLSLLWILFSPCSRDFQQQSVTSFSRIQHYRMWLKQTLIAEDIHIGGRQHPCYLHVFSTSQFSYPTKNLKALCNLNCPSTVTNCHWSCPKCGRRQHCAACKLW